MQQSIALGADHAGFDYKELVKEWLPSGQLKDFGTYSPDPSDYADFAHPVAKAVEDGDFDKGILICGSANGVAITANKHQGVRAAICWTPELAQLARKHNDANILCLPARFITEEVAREIVDEFLKTGFEGGRHQRRIDKIPC